MPKAYVDQLKLLKVKLRGFKRLSGELSMECLFVFERKRTTHKNKHSAPLGDVDNLIGSIMDACEGVIYDNDRMITEIKSEKMWGDRDLVFVTIKEL